MMNTLIVIDMQNDFVTGSLGTKEAQAIVPNIRKKIQEYIDRGDQVFFTRDTHSKNYLKTQEGEKLPVKHCMKNSVGWEIIDGLNTDGSLIINKSQFGFPYWYQYDLRGDIEIAGVCTDICVVSNALIIKAQFPEKEVTVDASCCAGVTPELHEAALNVMRSCQINVIGDEEE